MGASYGSENPSNADIYICTTGITKLELALINFPKNVKLQSKLELNTQYLVTYKFRGTAKHIQALKWGIPIVHAGYLYDWLAPIKKYEMRHFEGAIFSTSGVGNPVYGNYLGLLNAQYQPNASVFLDFLISDNETSEKARFCKKYGVPVVQTAAVFGNHYENFLREARADAKELSTKRMFSGQIFYLDSSLPQVLFNALKRLIIKYDGTRVSSLTETVDYIFTMTYDTFRGHESKLYHYQYIFDCAELAAQLHPGFYRVTTAEASPILKDCVCVVDERLGNARASYENKLYALGASIQAAIDMRTTHCIAKAAVSSTAERVGYHVVRPEWVDECLSLLRHVKEARFTTSSRGLRVGQCLNGHDPQRALFQFSGVRGAEKEDAVAALAESGARFSDSADLLPECTHLILGEMCTSEKFFLALASGIWILRPDVCKAYRGAADFDFEEYEWIAEDWMDARQKRQAKAIKKWRERIQNGRPRPFHKWVVKMYCAAEKAERYRRLIQQGGGKLADSKTTATHVFVDKSYEDEVPESKKLSADHLFSHLLK